MDDVRLERYAKVLLAVGVGFRAGQRLLVHAPTHAALLVRHVATQAYRAGAVNVDVLWIDREVDRARLRDGSEAAASELSSEAGVLSAAADEVDAVLRLLGDDEMPADPPVDPLRARIQSEAFQRARRPFTKAMFGGSLAWTMAAVPGPAWARRVFPELGEVEALEALWEAVARACRVDQDDAVGAWREHLDRLDDTCRYLDAANFESIRFMGPGTDLLVGLSPAHVWAHPGSAPWGCANVPTEEAPTAPHADRVQGQVSIRRPAVINDTLVEDAHLTFEDGAVIDASASVGEDALNALLDTPGGDRLGEISLVPQSSRVARERLVWHHILFDENDASHIALGAIIPPCIKGGSAMTPDELRAVGANISDQHIDLVVGADDVDALGIKPGGTEVELMRAGEWSVRP